MMSVWIYFVWLTIYELDYSVLVLLHHQGDDEPLLHRLHLLPDQGVHQIDTQSNYKGHDSELHI